MKHLLSGWLHRQAPAIAQRLAATYAAPAKAAGDPPDLDDLDLGDWADLVPDVEAILLQVADSGARAGLEQLGSTTGLTDQAHEDAASWAHDRAAELVGMQYDADGKLVPNPDAEWAITDGTRERLRGDVERAVEEGLSTDDFAAQLEDSYAFSGERAEMIARTEIAAADIQGTLIGYRDSGEVVGKEWLLGSEHDEPDECDDADAMGVVALDDDFGGIGDPPAHPNCVCDVLPVLAEEGEEAAAEE